MSTNDNYVIYNSNSFKRFRVNNNNIDNLSDSINEPTIRSRLSHVSTPSSTSSVALGYFSGEFGRKKYPRAPLSLTGRDSPSFTMNNLNLSSSASNSGRNAMTMNQNRKSTGSYFYTGKTTFGGSNLRKNIHRLSMTPYSPYSHVNVKCIEPMAIQRPSPTSRKGINHSIVDEDLPLSSVTQRILDRLDKAAAPISDAKSRIPISTLINNSAKKFDISRTPKLFDTPTPIIENRDRSPHIESSFKPMKYILKPSTSSSVNESTSTAVAADKSIDDDIQKLNQIKQAEKELKEQEKVQTKTFNEPTLRNFAQSSLSSSSSGKITARDVKKGRKIDDVLEMDNSHIKSLADVQPLATMTTGITLKPFSLNSSTPMNNSDKSNTFDIRSTCDTINNEFSFKFSSPKLVASLAPMAVRPTFQEINFSSPIKISKSKPVVQSASSSSTPTTAKSLFDQFIQSNNTWSCPICCTKNDNIDADKCIACEESNPHKKSSNNSHSTTEVVQQQEPIKFGDCNKLAHNPTLSPSSSSLPSLNKLFKKDSSNNWTCPTCSVSNNIEENRCISCEEPNPHHHSNKKTSTSNNQMNNLAKFSFGSISTGTDSETASSNTENSSTVIKPPSLFDVIQKKKSQDKQQWTCPTCMVSNESNVDRCVSCEEPNPNQSLVVSQTKSSTTTPFGFKFGISTTTDNCQKVDHSPTTTTEEWQCFYCKATNKSDDIGKNVCNECGKIKVMAATKDQVQKFYQTQTFKFGLSTPVTNKDVETETKLKKQDDKTSNDIPRRIPCSSGGFKFGVLTPSNSISNSPSMTSPFSTPKTTVPLLSFGSSLSSSSPSIVKPIESKTDKSSSLFSFGTTTTNSATDASLEKTTKPNTDSTSTTSTSSSLFAFGADPSKSGITFNKNDKESSNEDNNKNKTITSFGFNAISSTSSSTDTKPPMSTGLFSFGGAKPSDSSKPSLPSSFSKDTSTSSAFTFGGAVTSTTTISSSTTTTTKSTSGTLFGKELNFGSPITVPKIDPGPPIPKITISFAHPGTVTTSTATTGSVGHLTSNTLFTFGSSPNITLNANPAPVFGSNSIPTSFNFMGTNATSNNNGPMGTGSIFTFGSKSNNEPQPQLDHKPATVGFNFGAPSNPLSFSSVATNNPVMPSFNTATPSSTLFKFGSQEPSSNPSFQSFPTSTVEGNNNLTFSTSLLDPQQQQQQPDLQQQTTGLFQFQPSNAANMQQRPNQPSRTIKKAKRRLK